jgi:4-amino-4-deoxy-L-arabinose transferase-like glycosyltransferase
MNSSQQTSILPADGPLSERASAPSMPFGRVRVRTEHLALGAILALSALLNVNRLSHNQWANIFYSAAVRSMLGSLHNFVYVSFDPGGMVTVDKPPLGLWVQALSAKVFGLTPLSLLLPEAIMGVLGVAALYWVVRPRFGAAAAIASALALAVFPSFVAVSRDNNLDSLLILLMILACGVGLRAIETGRLRTLLGCAVLVGLAFNTKTLAAYLVVPGLALGYLVCAPGALSRRVGQLLAAGAMLVVVSGAWIAVVELTPASRRPYVGGSTNNSELGLTFGYNGFGRVGGQVGGPGEIRIVLRHGSLARIEKAALQHQREGSASGLTRQGLLSAIKPPPLTAAATAKKRKLHPRLPSLLPNGHARNPTAFGGPTGALRLFDVELNGQGAWMLPFALLGLIALAFWSFAGSRAAAQTEAPLAGAGPAGDPRARPSVAEGGQARFEQRLGRRGPIYDRGRLGALIVLGGWFLVEFAVLSFSKGIVHPYYISALGPGTAAMVGGGAVAFIAPGPRRRLRMALIPIAVAATVVAQIVVLHDERYLRWFWPLLAAGAALGVLAILTLPRWRSQAMALLLGLLLVAPAVYAATTWGFDVEGTFPAAGPHAAGAYGKFGISSKAARVNRELIAYLRPRHPGTRWKVLTEASDSAAPLDLLGFDTGAMGGYSGYDPALNGPGLARLVQRGEARYVVIGGAYSERGGNAAATAVLDSCRLIPTAAWQPRPVNRNSLLLFDCKGHERALRAERG